VFRNILVPTDFSAASRDALRCARELAAALGARLHVMHVIENTVAPNVYTELYVPPPSEYLDGLEAAAVARLDEWLPAEDRIAFRIGTTVRLGVPAEEILQRIDEDPKIDLVVMATHGRRGVKRLMLGSVAERVVRAAKCPVVTVKEGGEPVAERAA
jgi:nucleotide-binding universal stress UspA family protein